MKSTLILTALGLAPAIHGHFDTNSTYFNPIIPGFHPDPSCVFVPEWEDTFFCAVSSFIAFPGMPVFASKDLQNWRLVSHVHNRPEQAPTFGNISRNSGGWYAPTLRFHEGTFYVINVDVDAQVPSSGIFTTTNPYQDSSWSNLMPISVGGYDPDLFFDSDGTVYIQYAATISNDPFTTEIDQVTVDLSTGNTSEPHFLSNGTGVQPPEGPHLYYKDGYYWLLLAEGGTALDHQVTMSRSKSPTGPWELDPANPVLTAINSSSLFQTVGHADLFHDAAGNWWACALSTRSGPEYVHWPMNREGVLTPVSWPGDGWPVFDPVDGLMSGPLPRENPFVAGRGQFVGSNDYYKFAPGTSLPEHFTFWRFPKRENYVVSPPRHPYRLQLTPSNANLTGSEDFSPLDGQTFVGRRQEHTLFSYRVAMDFSPSKAGEEAGVTVFLRQERNAELGLISMDDKYALRFRATGPNAPETVDKEVPQWWAHRGIQFEIKAFNFTHYSLSAGPKGKKHLETVALVDNSLFSTSFTGVFVGVYATTNGNGEGGTKSYFSDWRYKGIAQAIGIDEYHYEGYGHH
ncbi:glycoside hydrolase family 43 protein [Hortaea werneckii]|nr:glycoside hydrolase family 43 protein [Hortaea werneckii]KAI7317559.1 glycoside hydrolase family 43 protein [Hortaea werneckii]